MSLTFGQQVSIIGKSDDLMKALALPAPASDCGLDTIHLSASMKVAPAFPLGKASKMHPSLIFASTSFCDCDAETIYRFLVYKGKYIPVAEGVNCSEIDSHTNWVALLDYNKVVDYINDKKFSLNPIKLGESSGLKAFYRHKTPLGMKRIT